MGWTGKLLHIHIAPEASYEMEELSEAELVAGKGIVGDRYYFGKGTYSPKPCLLYTSPSPRDAHESRMPSSA